MKKSPAQITEQQGFEFGEPGRRNTKFSRLTETINSINRVQKQLDDMRSELLSYKSISTSLELFSED